MKVFPLSTSFTEADLIEYSPFVAGLHKLRFGKTQVFENMLGYQEHEVNIPFYTYSEQEMQSIASVCEQVYDALHDAVGVLFEHESFETINRYFGAKSQATPDGFIQRYPSFLAYAKHSYKELHSAIYGRFDFAYDDRGGIKFYEFNGDTPTMLFESSVVQDVMLTKLGLGNEQYNFWFENFQKNIRTIVGHGELFAVIANMNVTTDAMTAEYIYNAATSAGVESILMDVQDLEYDVVEKRFHYKGNIVNTIYILKPWEEMVEEFDHLGDWPEWEKSFRFLEPAWRWFTSNKGIWAYVDNLFHADLAMVNLPERACAAYQAFRSKHESIIPYLLRCYLDDAKPVTLLDYVAKPMIGRCSQSIRVYHHDELLKDTGGYYRDFQSIVQELHYPPSSPGRNPAVTCMWMSPYDYAVDPMAMEASLLTIRECSEKVTDIATESIYPARVNDEVALGS